MKVFVYGTLKQGYGNHRVMQVAGGKFLFRAFTDPGFDLISLGGFPGAIDGTHHIIGEVYEVDRIEPLDSLEGYPRLYGRRTVTVWPVDGREEPQEALIYIYNRDRNRWAREYTQHDITFDEASNTKAWDRNTYRS